MMKKERIEKIKKIREQKVEENKKQLRIQPLRTQQGITLIALIITIVILIILATITINFVFNDGLIKRAEQASEFYANDTKYTDESLANVEGWLDGAIPFQPQQTPEPEGGGEEMTDMTHGVIEIKWLSGTSYNVSSTPNPPKIKEDLPEGTSMEQVVFNESGTTERERWVAGTEYSYVAGEGSSDNTSSHWANARVTTTVEGESIDSYFVWIPRYAYRLIYFDSDTSKQAYQEGSLTEEEAIAENKIIGYSDSRGIVDSKGRKIESVASTTHTMVSSDYFMVHPAFTNGETTGYTNGEWREEIEGIWIGKYEASSVEGNSNSPSEDNTTTKHVKVQPGVSSWRYIQIGNAWQVSQNYASELNSHMLKNSEWGAVVYLTESKYGRNGHEITINNNGTTFYTGGGTGNTYTTSTNQSSTGNVYGIYDLSGNGWEYVAGYYNEGTTLTNGSTFADGTSDEFSTAYTGTSANAAYKYGDATYETNGWHSDHSDFVNSDTPFFRRGGSYGSGLAGGIFGLYMSARCHDRLPLIPISPNSIM